MINLVVFGAAGRMGARVCALAHDDERFELVGEIDECNRENASAKPNDPPSGSIDAIIDFSSDAGARKATQYAIEHEAALLICTTALLPQTLDIIEVASRNLPAMIAPNTSFGVAVLIKLVTEAARLLGSDFQVNLTEIHHVLKKDAPSGTALRIAESLRKQSGIELGEAQIHSLRSGDVIGEHTVEFGGPGERIKIQHFATNRDLFAHGALKLTNWLTLQPPGLYTVEQAICND